MTGEMREQLRVTGPLYTFLNQECYSNVCIRYIFYNFILCYMGWIFLDFTAGCSVPMIYHQRG